MTASSLDSAYAPVTGARNLWPLLPAGLAVFGASALVYFHTHPEAVSTPPSALQSLVIGVYSFLGFAPGFMLLVLLLSWSSVWWFTGRIERVGARAVRLLAFTIALAVLINLREVAAQPHTGALGWWVAERLVSLFGAMVSTMLMAPLCVAALILATDGFFYRYFEGMMRPEDAATDAVLPSSPAPIRPEVGVEAEAAEHLKSLAEVAAAPASFADVQAEVLASLSGASPAVARDEASIEASAIPSVVEPASRRGSRRSRWYEDEPIPEQAMRERPAASPVAPAPVAPAPAAAEPAAAEPAAPALAMSPDVAVDALAEAPVAGSPVIPTAATDDEFTVAAASMADTVAPAAAPPVALADLGGQVPDDAVESPLVLPRRGYLAPIVEESAGDSVADAADLDLVLPKTPPEDPADVFVDETPAAAMVGAVAARSDVPEPEAAGPAIDIERDLVANVDPAPLADPTAAPTQAGDEPVAEPELTGTPPTADPEATAAVEPVIAIPRPPEGVRQQRLFVAGFDDQLLHDAIELVTSTRRASVTHLQRKLRIEYDQAMELLALLGRRGVIEIGEGETQGRVVGA